jgi:hypothetical protein
MFMEWNVQLPPWIDEQLKGHGRFWAAAFIFEAAARVEGV